MANADVSAVGLQTASFCCWAQRASTSAPLYVSANAMTDTQIRAAPNVRIRRICYLLVKEVSKRLPWAKHLGFQPRGMNTLAHARVFFIRRNAEKLLAAGKKYSGPGQI